MAAKKVPLRSRGKTSRPKSSPFASVLSVAAASQQGGVVSAASPNPPRRMKAMAEFRINSGEVSLALNDEELTLKPTIRAATIISRQFDGFGNARAALVRENFDATVFILRHGLSLGDKEARDLPDRVYKNGVTAELLIPLIRYVAILGNGGKPLPEDIEEIDQGEPTNPNP